jgi:aryl-alcohol dehydrogenase-like predicted oxidoreductase
LRYRLFGPTGLRVSELFLGTMTFGSSRLGLGITTPAECRKLVDVYAEAGGNVIDTASAYTDGQSEKLVGELLGSDRDHFVMATKYSLTESPDNPNASGNSRRNLTRTLETSLERLRTDHVDILWVHIWDRNTPLEETMRALDDAVRAGKVLYVGISDSPAWVVARANTLAEWRDWTAFAGIQVLYNLVTRDVERELLPMADHLGLSVAAWSPLAGGLLSGKFTGDGPKPDDTRVDPDHVGDRDHRIAATLVEVAADIGATPAATALAWLMGRSRSIHPIIGARRVEQLTGNLAAADLTLPEEAAKRLDEVSAIPLGWPTQFIDDTNEFVHGRVHKLVDGRRV